MPYSRVSPASVRNGADRAAAGSIPLATLTITLLAALLLSISLQFYRFSGLNPGLRDG
jgi:hypothetical protein